MRRRFSPQRTAHDMLAMMREKRPGATYHDLERALCAQRKRYRRGGAADAQAYLDEAIALVRAERAMITARRAALPRLHPWHEYYARCGGA
jgi:hypothetical protein